MRRREKEEEDGEEEEEEDFSLTLADFQRSEASPRFRPREGPFPATGLPDIDPGGNKPARMDPGRGPGTRSERRSREEEGEGVRRRSSRTLIATWSSEPG